MSIDLPIFLYCQQSDSRRTFRVRLTFHGTKTRPQTLNFIDEFMNMRPERMMMALMYAQNALLNYVAGGAAPDGVSIVEEGAKGTPDKCNDWFITPRNKKLFFNTQFLVLKEGTSLISIGDESPPSEELQWRELTPRTWADWWKAVDDAYHFTEQFERGRVTPASRASPASQPT